MTVSTDGQPAFTLISSPEFSGEPETISVKVPSELKDLLRDIGETQNRNLSEVVSHALGEYAKYFREHVSSRKKKRR